MINVEYLNNFSTNKIIWDLKIDKQIVKAKDISTTALFTLDTENTNDNNKRCITYATQLMQFATKKKGGEIEPINEETRVMNLFTHPVLFWEYIHNCKEQNIELYVFNAEYDVNNLLNFGIKRFNLTEQNYSISEVEEYEGMYKDETKKLSYKDTYTYKKMNRNGKIYRCEIQLDNCKAGKTSGVKKLTIIDMAKKLTGKLSTNVECFTHLKMNKADLDYSIFRDYGHTAYTNEELLYMWNDVYCLADLVLEYVYSGKYNHTDKITTSSMALANYKDELTTDFISAVSDTSHILHGLCNEYIEYCRKTKIVYLLANGESPKYIKLLEKYYNHENTYHDNGLKFIMSEYFKTNDIFDFIYPKLSYNNFDYVRTSYCGGITRFKNKNDVGQWLHGEGIGIDINSSFPYSYTTFKLPYGNGELFTNVDNVPTSKKYVYVVRIRVSNFKIKNNKEPNISKVMMETIVSKKNIDTWVKEFKGDSVITLTSPDYQYFIKNYEYEYIEILDYIRYKAINGLFNAFTNKFYGIKCEKGVSKGIRSWVKLILNGVYGKFGQNKCSELRRDLYNNNTNSIEDVIVKDNDTNIELISEGVYIPVASFVTAYSRLHLIEVLNIINKTKGIEWKYCDTDSAYVMGDVEILKKATEKYIDLENTGELGKWKIEKYFSKILIIGIKKYIYFGNEEQNINYSYHVTLSGINNKYFKFIENYCITNDNCICELSEDKEFIEQVNKENKKYYVGDSDNPFIYKDKELTEMVFGAYRSIRKKTVLNGQILYYTIYCIKGDIKNENNF